MTSSLRVRLPIWRRGCGIRSRLLLAPAAFCSSFRTACERFLDTRMGYKPLATRIGDTEKPLHKFSWNYQRFMADLVAVRVDC